PTRDFSFVEDTVRGFIAAMESKETIGTVTNIGSGFEISIGDTAKCIAGLMGAEIEIESGDSERLRPAASEVERLFASYEKAERLMQWKPAFGGREGFERGLRKTIDWFTEAQNLASYKSDQYNL
ncbi:MAG TPA: GDP-mannose 4,6-dehydratase, partial [Steroidobacteraceae bacterium]